MSRTITRLFDSHTEALRAVETLEAQGIDHDKISIISNNSDNWHAGHRHSDGEGSGLLDRMGDRAEGMAGSAGDMNHDGENDVAEGAGKGATSGGILGAGAGLMAGLGMLAIPGLGPVVAAGWLASMAVGAAVGAAAGGATGGLLGALKEAGHTDEEANVYSEGVRRGGTLVSVKADDDDAETVEQMLNSNAGIDAGQRSEAYRSDGWTGFDASAQPYSSDQIATERQRYAEARSFAGSNAEADAEFDARERGFGDGDRGAETPTRSF